MFQGKYIKYINILKSFAVLVVQTFRRIQDCYLHSSSVAVAPEHLGLCHHLGLFLLLRAFYLKKNQIQFKIQRYQCKCRIRHAPKT